MNNPEVKFRKKKCYLQSIKKSKIFKNKFNKEVSVKCTL